MFLPLVELNQRKTEIFTYFSTILGGVPGPETEKEQG